MPYTTIPVPENNFILTQIGIDYLKNKFLNNEKGVLASFVYGDTTVALNQQTTDKEGGNRVHEGTAAAGEMFFTRFHEHEVTIKCRLTHDIGDWQGGSIAILADDGSAVFVGSLNYSHSKLQSIQNRAGGRLAFQFRFLMNSIHDHWDFSNLTEHYVHFDQHTGAFADAPQRPIYAEETEHITVDEAILDTNRKGYVWLPRVYDLSWVSPPFLARLDDSEFDLWPGFSGGFDGDGHKYTHS